MIEIWKDSYKSGRILMTIQSIEHRDDGVQLTLDSNNHFGVIVMTIPAREYPEMNQPKVGDDCDVQLFAEAEVATRLAHCKGRPAYLTKNVFREVPYDKLRVSVFDFDVDKPRKRIIGFMVSWTLHKP